MKKLTLLILVLLLAAPAGLGRASGCDDSPGGFNCDAGDSGGGGSGGGGSSGGSSSGGDDSSSDPSYYYEYDTGPHGACSDPERRDANNYQLYKRYRYYPATGESQYMYDYCAAPNSVDPNDPSAARPPPPPPSTWEINDSFERQIPYPTMQVNPDRRGLTGLETRLWANGSTSVSGSMSIRGYSVTASAGPTQYKWVMGDGGVYYTSHPGSRDAPAVRHTYETKDLYTLVLEVSWSGSYTWSGFGQSGSGSLGPWTRSDRRPYRVVEVRSVLRR